MKYNKQKAIEMLEYWYDEWTKDVDWWVGNNDMDIQVYALNESDGSDGWSIEVFDTRFQDGYWTCNWNQLDLFYIGVINE